MAVEEAPCDVDDLAELPSSTPRPLRKAGEQAELRWSWLSFLDRFYLRTDGVRSRDTANCGCPNAPYAAFSVKLRRTGKGDVSSRKRPHLRHASLNRRPTKASTQNGKGACRMTGAVPMVAGSPSAVIVKPATSAREMKPLRHSLGSVSTS